MNSSTGCSPRKSCTVTRATTATPPSKDREQGRGPQHRSEEHTSELQSLRHLVCRLLLEKKKHAEGVISYACQRVAEERADDAVAMGRTPEFLKAVKPPVERMTSSEALKVLQTTRMELEW